jgi:hypothetical protein
MTPRQPGRTIVARQLTDRPWARSCFAVLLPDVFPAGSHVFCCASETACVLRGMARRSYQRQQEPHPLSTPQPSRATRTQQLSRSSSRRHFPPPESSLRRASFRDCPRECSAASAPARPMRRTPTAAPLLPSVAKEADLPPIVADDVGSAALAA